MARDFLGRGWRFPIDLELDRGRIAAVAYEEDVKQSILLILKTAKGERLMRPDFGCGIHDLVFSSITHGLVEDIRRNVMDALRVFEARIEVIAVQVDAQRAWQGRLIIELHYLVRATNQRGNLVFPFYFKEGA